MKKSIIYGVITILILSTFATAQFPKFKIPKITKPKIPKIDKNIGENVGKDVGSSKGSNRQMVIDDGYTFFEAEPVKERSEKYRGFVAKGWTLKSSLRAFGTYPDSSSFKVVVEDNGKAVATYGCLASLYYRKAGNPSPNVRNSPIDDYLTVGNCTDGKLFIKEPGKYDVKVSVVNGDTDEETALRTYKIDVRELKTTRPGNVPGVSDFYINRHAETAAAILYLRPSGLQDSFTKASSGYFPKAVGGGSRIGNTDIYFNVSLDRYQLDLSRPHIRCFVDGERVNFKNKGNISTAPVRSEVGVKAHHSKPGEYISFYEHGINMPFGRSDQKDLSELNLADYPGQWECQLRSNVETIRTFRWTVGSDGYPVEHPEQKNGNINLFHGAYLIDMEIPEGGSSLDVRLAPMPEAGVFYGIPWSTPEGKKMAAEVPTKGKPYID